MFTRNMILLLFLAVVLTLAACGGPVSATPQPKVPGAEGSQSPALSETEALSGEGEAAVLKIGWLGKPDTLNPADAVLTESYIIFNLVYSTLIAESVEGDYIGVLAKDWTHSKDGLTWTFNLKDGIKWHDGTEFTAEDMAWAINAVMQDPDGWAAAANYAEGFKEVKALDPKTLQISLENPIGNMEYRLSFLYAAYPEDFQEFTTPGELQNFTNFEIMGTGPFKMNTFDKDKGILILDANTDYFETPPKIDQIVFQTFDNPDAMVQALKAGEIDMVTEVPQSAFAAVEAYANVKALSTPGRYFDELIINSVPSDHDPAPKRNPALEDPQVRLAIAHAIDKQELVDIVFQGLGEPLDTIVPPTLGGGFWHNPNIQDVSFDLVRANQILEEAGYTLGSDGVRAKGDVHLDFRLQFPSDKPIYPGIADLLASWFQQAGIKATPESVDPDSLKNATTPTGDFDLVLWGWGPDPDPDFILGVMTSDQFIEGGWNDSGYMNPEYDHLYLDQQMTVDQLDRQQIIWDMQELVFDDRPYIVLLNENLLQAYREDRFTGFIASPLGIEYVQSLVQVEPVR